MKTKTFTAEDPALPMNYPGFVFRTLREEGCDADALLEGIELTQEQLADPDHRFGVASLRRLILNAIEHTGDPHLSIRLAHKFDPAYIGAAAYAMINAPTFKDALEVQRRFTFLAFPNIQAVVLDRSPSCGPGEMAIRLSPKLPLGDIAYFVSSSTLLNCDRLWRAVLRTPAVAVRGELMVSRPKGWDRVSSQMGFPVRFGAQDDLLVFPRETLHQPLPGADPITHARLLKLCERLSADSGFETTLPSLVLSYLRTDQNCSAPLSQAAAALGYSERGLRRQLERSGTSYRKLTEQVLESRARELLLNSSRPITTIAQDLGYDTPSNFARSFKRWTGSTPKAFRENRRAKG